MRTYHILFKNNLGLKETTSTGENIVAENPIQAYSKFLQFHSHHIEFISFIGMYDLEALGSLRLNSESIKEQADVDDVIRLNKEDSISKDEADFRHS